MQTSPWLAMSVSDALSDLKARGQTVVAIHKTSAPGKQQEGEGLWRVVKVQETSDGTTLTVAWQKAGVALERDVELG